MFRDIWFMFTCILIGYSLFIIVSPPTILTMPQTVLGLTLGTVVIVLSVSIMGITIYHSHQKTGLLN